MNVTHNTRRAGMRRLEWVTHAPARRRHLECECGYQADDHNDLDEHIVTAARSES